MIDDVMGMECEEIVQRIKYTAKLIRCLHWKEKMLQQQAKEKWILKGDTNTKFFNN